jgi:hypothetical protein
MRVRFSAAVEVENRTPCFHPPARRFVAAGHALEIDTVFVEVQILFVPANGANQTLKR